MLLQRIALLLTIIGGLNWGLIGAFNFDLVKFLFGFIPVLVPIIQILVGIAAIYVLFVYMIKQMA